MAKVKTLTSEIFKLKDWRLSFAQLDKPKAFKPGQDARYEATFLADPTRADHKAQIGELMGLTLDLVKRKWGNEADLKENKPEGLALCFGLADKNPKKAKYDGYKGMFYLVTANKDAPTIVTRDREAVVPGKTQWPYSGCHVNTNPTLWVQDNEFGIAVRANLRIVQFVDDDTPFGRGSANPDDEFEKLPARGKTGPAEVDNIDF